MEQFVQSYDLFDVNQKKMAKDVATPIFFITFAKEN